MEWTSFKFMYGWLKGGRTLLTTPEVHDKRIQGREQRAPYTLFLTHSTLILQMRKYSGSNQRGVKIYPISIVLDLTYVSCSKTKLLLLHTKLKSKSKIWLMLSNFRKRKTIFYNPTKFSAEKEVVCFQNYWLLGELTTQSLTGWWIYKCIHQTWWTSHTVSQSSHPFRREFTFSKTEYLHIYM